MKAKKKQHKQRTLDANQARSPIVPLLLLAAIGIISYWNSFHVPLVFDDIVSIQKNAGVRFGDYLNPSIFFRGVLYITFTLNYLLHGQEVWGYHLVNVLLHLLNGFLIYFIAKHVFDRLGIETGRSSLYAFFSAAIFIVHPVQTESVTYISSRSELLSTFFYEIAFLAFIKRPVERIGFIFSLIISAIFMLGIGAKETVISLPAVLLLYDFIFLSNSEPRKIVVRWRFYLTFILGAIVVGYILVTSVLVGSIGTLEGHLTPWHYFLTQIRVMVRYVQILFVPVGLNLDYDFRPSVSLLDPALIACAFLLAGIVVLGWQMRRKNPVFSFSIFWFFLTLAPTSSVVPILDVIFEHRLYLPMVGICLSFPLLIDLLANWISSKFAFRIGVVQACSALLLLALVGTVLRNHVWRDEVTLWKDVVQKSPHKVRPYGGLTYAYFKLGDYQNALEVSKVGIQNVPAEKKRFYDQMGNMYLKLNRYAEAADVFKESVKAAANPSEVSYASNNLGVTYLYMWDALQHKQAQMTDADFMAEKERILGLAEDAFVKSNDASTATFWAFDSYINVIYARGSRIEEVRQDLLQKAQGRSPFAPLYGLGKLNFLDKNYQGAADYFEKALKLDQSQKVVYFNYAYALSQLNQTDRAIDQYLAAIRIDPLFIDAHYNAGLLYMVKKDFPTALDRFNEVLRNDPKFWQAHLNIAKVYMQEGLAPEARQHLATVLTLSPQNAEATSLMQRLGSLD